MSCDFKTLSNPRNEQETPVELTAGLPSFCLSFMIPISHSWSLTAPSFLDGSSTLLPSPSPGDPSQKEYADEQEDAAGHCYLILHCKYERLHSGSSFCGLWEVCRGDGTGNLTLRKRISASLGFSAGWKQMMLSFIYTCEPGMSPLCLSTDHFADAGGRTSL